MKGGDAYGILFTDIKSGKENKPWQKKQSFTKFPRKLGNKA